MKVRWDIGPRGPRDRVDRQFRSITLRPPLRDRIDVVLVAGILGVLFLLVSTAAVVVDYGYRTGWFDKPVIQTLDDPRKLVNVRDYLGQQPLLDAVFHPPEGRIFLSQAGGLIHKYDPATGLWSTSSPLLREPVSPDMVQLRSGCGADPLSVLAPNCPDPRSLWLLGADGSLARHRGSRWETVLSNSTFVGANGHPISAEELTAAAVSDDDRWVVLGTVGNGFGFYDTESRSWMYVVPDVAANLPSRSITQLVFWRGFFWLGTDAGLASARVTQGRIELQNKQVNGNIVELEVEPERLWVLAERPCAAVGDECLWLGQFEDPDGEPETVLYEKNRYQQLSLAAVNFADFWDKRLILGGEAGIYIYDPEFHSWDQLFDQPVTTVLTNTGEAGLHFGFPGGVGRVTRDFDIGATWPITGEAIIKLVRTDRDLLALTAAGNAWSVKEGADAAEVFHRGHTNLDPTSFTSALAVRDQILLVGADGAVLHNTGLRTYQDIPSTAVPDWMKNPGIKYLDAGGSVFGLEQSDGSAIIRVLPGAAAVDASYYTGGGIRNAQTIPVPYQPRTSWPWESKGIGIVTEDGQLHLVDTDSTSLEVGEASPVSLADFVDVAQIGDRFLVTDGRKVDEYNLADRDWVAYFRPTLAGNEAVNELAAYGNRLLMRTSEGRLLQNREDRAVMIGKGAAFAIGDAALTDVVMEGGDYYLAGGGRVEMYNAQSRTIERSWNLQGDGSVALKGILGGQPLALSDGIISLGRTPLGPNDGRVLSTSVGDGYIWTVRQADDVRFLQGHSLSAPVDQGTKRCFFRQPYSGGSARVTDAQLLPDGTIAVATDSGLRLYSAYARSWYAVDPDPLPNGGRIYLLGHGRDLLLLLAGQRPGGSYDLRFVSPESIQLPHTCSTDPAALEILESLSAVGFDVDERQGRLAWIDRDGGVWEWQGHTRAQVLPPIVKSPAGSDLLRVYDRGSVLLFTSLDGLWRYHIDERRWEAVSLEFPTGAGTIVDVNLEPSGDAELVTAASSDGSLYIGELAAGEPSVDMSRIYQGGREFFGADAIDLVDVQDRQGSARNWTFVLRDRILYYNPVTRTWSRSPVFQSSTPLDFQDAEGRGVLVGNEGRTWWVATRRTSQPLGFTEFRRDDRDVAVAIDGRGAIWRLLPDGQIMRCEPSGNAYACAQFRPPAFVLDPSSVRRAFEWGFYLLFETDAGLRAYDTVSGLEAALRPDAAGFTGLVELHEWENLLLLYNGSSLVAMDSGLQTDAWNGIQDMVIDSSGMPWADFAGDWRYFRGGVWTSAGDSGPEGLSIQVFALPGSTPAGLDADGFAYYWTGSQFRRSYGQLPEEIPAIEGLIQGKSWDWWALAQGQLYYIRRELCVRSRQEEIPVPPDVYPCFQIAGQIELPLGPIAFAETFKGGLLHLRDESGSTAAVSRAEDGQYSVSLGVEVSDQPAPESFDRWPELRSNIVNLASGEPAYDPFTELSLASGDRLVALRSSGQEESLSTLAVMVGPLEAPFDLPAALDSGWLKWDRATESFEVRSVSGTAQLPKDQFVRDGRLICEDVTAILPAASGEVYAATAYGVWEFVYQNLSLADRSIVYYPPALDTLLVDTASHGRFLSPSQAIVVGSRGLQTGRLQLSAIQVDEVSYLQQTDPTRVEVTVSPGGLDLPGFAAQGFIWDSGRRALAYQEDSLLLQSNAGIHNVRQLSGFDGGPHGLELRTGRIQSDGKGVLYLDAGGVWHRRDGGAWASNVTNPVGNRSLLQTPFWDWTLQDNQLQIRLGTDAFDFHLVQTGQGLGLTSDQLLSAAAFDSRLYIATRSFFEVAGQPGDLTDFTAARKDPIDTESLETVRFSDGRLDLFSYGASGAFRWDAQQSQFMAIQSDQDPALERVLMETNLLRFTWNRGRVEKELRIESISGEEWWVPFRFVQGRFPFDYVTAVDTFDSKLYLGTAAGLTVSDSPDDIDLGQLVLVDIRPGPADSLEAVDRVGVPLGRADRIMALSDQGCIEQRIGQPISFCSDPALLEQELKASTDFWQWSGAATGQVSGNYITNASVPHADAIRLSGNRWPHDILLDARACGGRLFELWRDGWVSVHGDTTTTINRSTVNFLPIADDPRRLICVSRDVSVSDRDLKPGIYLEGTEGRVWAFAGANWAELTDAGELNDLRLYADAPPVYYRDRLRLLAPSPTRGFAFEQRTLSGRWAELPWSDAGRIAIDEWCELAFSAGHLWAATPAGLVSFQRAANSDIVANPDNLLVIREPRVGASSCLVSDLRVSATGVLARCDYRSDLVYQGRLSQNQDASVFTKLGGQDPFAEQPYVQAGEDGFWSFSLTNRANGNPGYLEGLLELHGLREPIRLVGGRFQFDTPNTLAAFQDGWIELATDGAGWYRAPSGSQLHVGDLTRSPIAADIGAVNWAGLSGLVDNQLLCLQSRSSSEAVLLDSDFAEQGRQETCAEFQGSDSFWLYQRDSGRLVIMAPGSRGGQGHRELTVGRFSDDIAVGIPATRGLDGQITYLVPTVAGVVELDEGLNKMYLYAGPFNGLGEDEVPSVMYMVDQESPAYVAGGKLFDLETARTELGVPLSRGPWSAGVTAIGPGPYELTKVDWEQNKMRQWSLIALDGSLHAENTLFVDVNELDKYVDHQAEWGSPQPQLTVYFPPGKLYFEFADDLPWEVQVPAGFELIDAILFGNRILLVGRQELLEFNLESAMAASMNRQ